MIDDPDNCPYSYHDEFPGVFLFPAEVNQYVSIKDDIATLGNEEKAILFQLILLATGKQS